MIYLFTFETCHTLFFFKFQSLENLTFEKWVKNCYSVSESKCHRNFSDGIHAEIFTNGVEDLFLTLNARQQKGLFAYIGCKGSHSYSQS